MKKTINMLTNDQLDKLTDVRLLAHYKALYPRIRKHIASFQCECCGMFEWELHPSLYKGKHKDELKVKTMNEINSMEDYLNTIKLKLNKRGHVGRSNIKKS
jgi:hypothetical protein